MKTAIRYYSKFGHSKQMAEAIAEVAGAKALPVSEPLTEPVDVLFLGAGVFLGKVNAAVGEFIGKLDPSAVKCVVCFGSSAIVASPVPMLRKMLESRGIAVAEQSFSCKGSMGPVHAGHPDAKDLEDFRNFVRGICAE
ncbi:MAG: hypothetical protein J6Y45_01910 [Bacteroidales bacterium]|nr:hypothetical protein [Bacteroidales bacterium]MBP5521655.1 hypothetical protein [Bacteroidales bacterium]